MYKRLRIACLCILVALSGCTSTDIYPGTSNMESSSSEETSNSTNIVEEESSDIFLPQNSTGGSADTMLLIEDLDDLEENSDYIVKGILQNDATLTSEELTTGIWFAITATHLEVTEIYKGDMENGELILLAEPYLEEGLREEYLETQQIVLDTLSEDYSPSIPDKEYIFFLKKVKVGRGDPEIWGNMYSPTDGEIGRYLVPDTQMSMLNSSEQEINLYSADPEIYEGIYEDVIEKYLQ